jgi:transposase
MRGGDVRSGALFSYVSCEARVPLDHPLRPIRKIADEGLAALSPEFEKLYAEPGRRSIAPEKLLRALLLQAFYSVRSEQQLVEQLNYNLLFRWFVGLSLDDEVWDETVFTKNRERLMEGDIAAQFLAAVLNQGLVKALMSDDHFSVKPAPAKAGGTLIEAWASTKSFRPKDGSGEPPGAPQPPTSLRRSAVTRSAPPASPPTSPTAARSSTPRKCGAREPAHDQALRPHEGAAHARRGGEDQAVSTENRAQLGR